MCFIQKYLCFKLQHANSNLHLLVSDANFLQLRLSFVLYKQISTIWPTTSHSEVCSLRAKGSNQNTTSQNSAEQKIGGNDFHEAVFTMFFRCQNRIKRRAEMNLSEYLWLGYTETSITRSYCTVVPVLIVQFSGLQITSKRKRAQQNGLRHVGKQTRDCCKTHTWQSRKQKLSFLPR